MKSDANPSGVGRQWNSWTCAMSELLRRTKEGKLEWDESTVCDGAYHATIGRLKIGIVWMPSDGAISLTIWDGAMAIEFGGGGLLAGLYAEILRQEIVNNVRQPRGHAHPQEHRLTGDPAKVAKKLRGAMGV